MHSLLSFFLGLLFGLGLIISGMSNPAKVQGFLDLAGHWDPSLALVMGGAVAIGLPGFTWLVRGGHSLLGGALQLPSKTLIDRRLIIGSALFGIGWGLAGICPGPALVLPGAGQLAKGGIFLVAILAGMLLFSLFERLNRAS